jgi:hypothetical protein
MLFNISSTIVSIFSNKISLIAPSVGCDPSQGFYKELILTQIGTTRDIVFSKWRDKKHGLSAFQNAYY